MVSLPPGMPRVTGGTPHRCRTNDVMLAGRPERSLIDMVLFGTVARMPGRWGLCDPLPLVPPNKRLKLASATGGRPSLLRPALTHGVTGSVPCAPLRVARSLSAVR
jgi:hypothetical protein